MDGKQLIKKWNNKQKNKTCKKVTGKKWNLVAEFKTAKKKRLHITLDRTDCIETGLIIALKQIASQK